MDTTSLPQLHDDDDWYDLKLGDKALAIGKNHRAQYKGDNGLILLFTNWSTLLIEITDATGLDRTIPVNEPLSIIITKTENGPTAASSDITSTTLQEDNDD